jgi:hypothetical protein
MRAGFLVVVALVITIAGQATGYYSDYGNFGSKIAAIVQDADDDTKADIWDSAFSCVKYNVFDRCAQAVDRCVPYADFEKLADEMFDIIVRGAPLSLENNVSEFTLS